MRNIDYLSYLNNIKNKYGEKSTKYKNALPDATVWDSYIVDGVKISDKYFKSEKFYNNPLVGVSYEQAIKYCEWRTVIVNQIYSLSVTKNKGKGYPTKVTFRLPTADEWAKISVSDSIYTHTQGMIKVKDIYQNLSESEIEKIKKDMNLTSSVYYFWKNKIGIYAFDDNVSEMISEKGEARGCNWKGGEAQCEYTEPTNWLGFRCVVDIEY